LSHELERFGTGLFSLGFSPIQKTVVTIWHLHGYGSPGEGGADLKRLGANVSESTPTRDSSDFFSDFLLNFTFVGSAFVTAPCANSDDTDESKAANVCVIFPGFIGLLARVRGKN